MAAHTADPTAADPTARDDVENTGDVPISDDILREPSAAERGALPNQFRKWS